MFVSVLTIIEVQNEIWDLEKKPANETNSERLKGQSILNGNIPMQSEIMRN